MGRAAHSGSGAAVEEEEEEEHRERTGLGRAKETIKRRGKRTDVKRILEKRGHPEKRGGS